MENIKSFSSFINESKIQEKTGISQAVYGDLKSYFEKCKKDDCKPNLKDAQAYVTSKKKEWKLSAEDFWEAKKEFC